MKKERVIEETVAVNCIHTTMVKFSNTSTVHVLNLRGRSMWILDQLH